LGVGGWGPPPNPPIPNPQSPIPIYFDYLLNIILNSINFFIMIINKIIGRNGK